MPISCIYATPVYFQISPQIRYSSGGSLLEDLDVCDAMSWGSAVLAYLYKELYRISTMETTQLPDCQTLLHVKP